MGFNRPEEVDLEIPKLPLEKVKMENYGHMEWFVEEKSAGANQKGFSIFEE